MTVYVDQPLFAFRGQMYCHVWADTVDELHAAAQRAGLKRSWFQEGPELNRNAKASWSHYDANPRIRAVLIAQGAVETDRYGPGIFLEWHRPYTSDRYPEGWRMRRDLAMDRLRRYDNARNRGNLFAQWPLTP